MLILQPYVVGFVINAELIGGERDYAMQLFWQVLWFELTFLDPIEDHIHRDLIYFKGQLINQCIYKVDIISHSEKLRRRIPFLIIKSYRLVCLGLRTWSCLRNELSHRLCPVAGGCSTLAVAASVVRWKNRFLTLKNSNTCHLDQNHQRSDYCSIYRRKLINELENLQKILNWKVTKCP